MTGIMPGSSAGAAPSDLPSAKGLRGQLGVFDLTMTVLAASAPLSVMAAFAPVSIAVGGGMGMVLAYLIAGAALAIFAVGFLAMGRRISAQGGNAGAFYAYVTRGLGRPMGLGAAFLAVFAYTALQTGTFGMLGQSIVDFLHGRLGLPVFQWWQAALAMWLLVGVLGYRHIGLSAKVLAWAMLGEIAVVLALDLAVLLKGSPTGRFSFEPFTLHGLRSGNAGIGIMFATATFIGFEATAIYSEEARNPNRTIPRATFISLAIIALLYSFSTFFLLNAYGVSTGVEVAHADPTHMFPNALAAFVGKAWVDVMYVLLISSLFAAVLSFHNAIARYFYSFGVDGVLPERFGDAHDRHGSPHAGSLLQSVVALAIVAPVVICKGDPVLQLYAWACGIGTLAMLMLLAISSVAILGYLGLKDQTGSIWVRAIWPGCGLACLTVVAVLATANFDALVSTSAVLSRLLITAAVASFAVGVLLALRLRISRPHCYLRIGRERG